MHRSTYRCMNIYMYMYMYMYMCVCLCVNLFLAERDCTRHDFPFEVSSLWKETWFLGMCFTAYIYLPLTAQLFIYWAFQGAFYYTMLSMSRLLIKVIDLAMMIWYAVFWGEYFRGRVYVGISHLSLTMEWEIRDWFGGVDSEEKWFLVQKILPPNLDIVLKCIYTALFYHKIPITQPISLWYQSLCK